MADHRFPYKWKKTELDRVDKHGNKVFSTFACAGGSSFGYKMAGFDVIGCNEIDPEMMALYRANHNPKHSFLEPIQDFKERRDFPGDLFDLDILDGSPPCFAAGTMVITTRGDVPIEDIRVGDSVLTHKMRWRTVIGTMNRVAETVLVGGCVETTIDHPFYSLSDNGAPSWLEIGKCKGLRLAKVKRSKQGYEVYYEAMHNKPILMDEPTRVYDLTVSEDHSFVAGGYVVHNCSTFSMAGSREKAWGKEKKFREGQAQQVLSDLFFDFLDVVEKLRPKIVVAENVKGMIIGKAKGYCKLIRDRFDELGYDSQLFLLNSASMGVPQTRERVFFIARRRDLLLPPLKMTFNEKPITFREMSENLPFQDLEGTEPHDTHKAFWKRTRPGNSYSDVSGGNYFNSQRLSMDKPSTTITASSHEGHSHPEEMRRLSWIEVSLLGSYPYDYDFLGRSNSTKVYCIGMSVPPVMIAHVAASIAEQWLDVPRDQIDQAWDVS